ncbi:hypothetical protein DFH09DRAFT_1330704 [Mycena vulgaris]|nr:hypothetical protein DFH09DRAFT_1330704 [Mycena vulgaris]
MSPPLYEPLPTSAPADELPPTPKRRRTSQWWITAGISLLLFVAFGFVWMEPGRTRGGDIVSLPPTTHVDVGQRVYLRVGALGSEGFGSALQHFKQSVILSRALDSTLILASEIRNTNIRPRAFSTETEILRPQWHRGELVRGWCAGDESAVKEMQKVRAEMVNCTGIVDIDETETTEDLNGCIMAWVRARLAPVPPPVLPPPLSYPPTRPVTVGVHIRWGDSAGQFRGSMAMPNIVHVLKDLRTDMGAHGLKITVAMEDADPDVLAQMEEPEYTLLDSGDAIADMHTLSANDFLLLGESSYGVMVHLIAPPGLTIVESGDHHKYDNTTGFGRDVVFMKDYTAESLHPGGMGE